VLLVVRVLALLVVVVVVLVLVLVPPRCSRGLRAVPVIGAGPVLSTGAPGATQVSICIGVVDACRAPGRGLLERIVGVVALVAWRFDWICWGATRVETRLPMLQYSEGCVWRGWGGGKVGY
jgi:hypothetical protein